MDAFYDHILHTMFSEDPIFLCSFKNNPAGECLFGRGEVSSEGGKNVPELHRDDGGTG